MKMKVFLLFTVLAFVVFTSSVFAAPISYLDFNMDAVHPAGASISYAGGATPLVGTNIGVDSVVGVDTPVNNGVAQAITTGILNFTTGPLTGSNVSTWFFGGGGAIVVTGTIAGIPGAGPTLLNGVFTNAIVVAIGGNFKVSIAAFIDDKDDKLVQYYGLPAGVPYLGNFNLSFNAAGIPPAAFQSTSVLSGDIVNSPVPEPGTLILIGAGLAGLVGYSRIKLSRKKS